VNVSRDDGTHEVERDHAPCLVLDNGDFVFEVWFWHSTLRCYFCLTRGPHAARAIAQGVIYFHPDDVPHALRARVEAAQLKLAS